MLKLFATDLDGTILGRGQQFNPKDIEVLNQLGKDIVTRVVATGRTIFAAKQVLPADFPIDYLVFSSGAGIYNWKTKELIRTKHLGNEAVQKLITIFNEFEVEYTIHYPIPDNHLFFHPVANKAHPDFERYIEFHNGYTKKMNGHLPEMDYSQTLAFMPDIKVYEKIAERIEGVKVVRATSPIDGKTIWMECFHPEVSKASGIKSVCRMIGVQSDEVSVLGNDYNDLDMLNAFDKAFVVDNAPSELKEQFTTVRDVLNAPLEDWYSKAIK
jgi:Cof subfamily protein (haloacid dehalogenase superfamily)